jgi:hypothetical protein
MLTGPHQMSSLLVSSKTIRLSLGLRPVFLPEKLISAPVAEMMAPSFRIASSYSWPTAALRLRWTLDMSKPAWEKYSRSWPRTMEASQLLCACQWASCKRRRRSMCTQDSSDRRNCAECDFGTSGGQNVSNVQLRISTAMEMHFAFGSRAACGWVNESEAKTRIFCGKIPNDTGRYLEMGGGSGCARTGQSMDRGRVQENHSVVPE